MFGQHLEEVITHKQNMKFLIILFIYFFLGSTKI
jgi:hypothetical protein